MSRRGWLLFAAMCVIWGVPYLMIRVAVRDISPAAVVFMRTALGALLLAPVAVRRGAWRALLPKWRPLLLYTAVEVAAPWWLLTTAEVHLSSALAGLMLAATPLFAVLLSRLSPRPERVDAVRGAGLVLGIAGVGALVGLQFGQVDLLAVGAVLLTALGYAIGPLIVSHRLADLPAVSVVETSLVVSAVLWAPWALLDWPTTVSAEAAASVVGLAVVCTAVAFVLFFALIGEVGPARSNVITFVNPAVAIALGVLVLNETFTAGMAVGFPLVLVGSVLATRRGPADHQRPPGSVAAHARAGGGG